MPAPGIAAVSFDFFGTVATHRGGRGRGALVRDYLQAQGWTFAPWDHQVLYDIFDLHGGEFAAGMPSDDLRAFTVRLARALIHRLRVDVDPAVVDEHADELWRILGPQHFQLFPETAATLCGLHAAGLRLAVVSNWQRGLKTFCDALGLGALLDVVVTSGESGWAKPDPRIFTEACRRLALSPARVLHVGDLIEEVDGARNAGLQALWINRGGDASGPPGMIRTLDEIWSYVDAPGGDA